MGKNVAIYSLGKFHVFSLAEQLDMNKYLFVLVTGFFSRKKTIFNNVIKRVDQENISTSKVICLPILFSLSKKIKKIEILWTLCFDIYCSLHLIVNRNKIDVIIGLSGSTSITLFIAKKLKIKTVVDRGAAHIIEQQKLLNAEYSKFNKQIRFNWFTIKRELFDYDLSDFIAIPSKFVRDTFLKNKINQNKLFINPYGSGGLFKQSCQKKKYKLELTYVGNISIQKGVHIIIEAAKKIYSILPEIHFTIIGKGEEQLISQIIDQKNMTYEGYKTHLELPLFMNRADLGLAPSIQDGYSLVVVQFICCKTPMIISEFVGAKDLLNNGGNSIILDNNNPEDLANTIIDIFNNNQILPKLIKGMDEINLDELSFNGYGNRWINFLDKL